MTQLTEAYDHIDDVKSLFSEYTNMLVTIDLSFSLYLDIQHYDDEAQDPAVKYAPPKGRLYLALHGGKAAGCIALRPLSDDRCELKRLYVRPQFRGNGIAGMLCERILEDAVKTGYREIYLDTLPELSDAIRLYEKLGFTYTDCYNDSPLDKTVFMKKALI